MIQITNLTKKYKEKIARNVESNFTQYGRM